jgi:Tol biopolymer transport system component
MRRFFVLFLLIATSASAFTLEEIMSLPFAYELYASQAKNRLVWLQNDRGARNLWISEGPEWRARQLTKYTGDDGTDIGEISFTPDGDSVVFTRGGDLETGGENTNPRSLPGGVEQAIYAISVHDGNVRRLAEGHEAAVLPHGDRVVFVEKKQLWSVPFDGSAKPEAIIATTGERNNLRWSPDGTKIAFVSARREHAFIGVYGFAAKKITYLDPGVDRDVAPVWSPDSKRIAFIRIPATRERISFTPHRTAVPWSIRVADRERDGWRHLYSIGTSARRAPRCSRRATSRSSLRRRVPTGRRSSTHRTRTTSTAATSGACRRPAAHR